MDASVLLFDARAGQLNTPDGAWQFAVKRELPRGDISPIVNLGGRHAVVDSTHSQREHVFIAGKAQLASWERKLKDAGFAIRREDHGDSSRSISRIAAA